MLEWNYSSLAKAYLKRPQYSPLAIAAMLENSKVEPGELVVDIGAGVGHLTKHLAEYGLMVNAIEPNSEMRNLGRSQFTKFENVKWLEGTGEKTNLRSDAFGLVTFGSSFNVCDRQLALEESNRILKSLGWFSCMWNHRDLSDPIQEQIESLIKQKVPSYNYGTRREDQSKIINNSRLFSEVIYISSKIIHKQKFSDLLEAWRSHATLQRQSGSKFDEIISGIDAMLRSDFNYSDDDYIDVPYETKIWTAQKKKFS